MRYDVHRLKWEKEKNIMNALGIVCVLFTIIAPGIIVYHISASIDLAFTVSALSATFLGAVAFIVYRVTKEFPYYP